LGCVYLFWFYAFKPKRSKICCVRKVPRKARRLQIEDFKEQHARAKRLIVYLWETMVNNQALCACMFVQSTSMRSLAAQGLLLL